MTKFTTVFFLSFICLVPGAFCEALDPEIMNALLNAQRVLTNSSLRGNATKDSSDAAQADNFLKQIAGNPKSEQQIYDLAADIMTDLVVKTNGDPNQMQKLLEQAKKNPEAFASQLSPAQKDKLKTIVADLPSKTP